MSNAPRNGVTNGVTGAFVTQPPTRPDPTRPISIPAVVCGVSAQRSHSSHGDLGASGAYHLGRDAVDGCVWIADPSLVILTGSQRVVYDEPAPADWKPPAPVGFAPPPRHRAREHE